MVITFICLACHPNALHHHSYTSRRSYPSCPWPPSYFFLYLLYIFLFFVFFLFWTLKFIEINAATARLLRQPAEGHPTCSNSPRKSNTHLEYQSLSKNPNRQMGQETKSIKGSTYGGHFILTMPTRPTVCSSVMVIPNAIAVLSNVEASDPSGNGYEKDIKKMKFCQLPAALIHSR